MAQHIAVNIFLTVPFVYCNMKKPLTICFFLFSSSLVFAQQKISEFVQKNTVPVSHVDPAKTEFDDLLPIGNAIGDARIVMLGEQDHGDAPAFLAKTRLVRYLHEQKGFNVLAFESDFFALNVGWDALQKESPAMDTFLRANIFQIWTLCDACQYLFHQYIPSTHKTKQPLTITGFDNQTILLYSQRKLTAYIDSSWRALDLPVTKREDYSSRIIPVIGGMLNQYFKRKEKKELFEQAANCIDSIRQELRAKLPATDYNVLLADNLFHLAKELQLADKHIESNETRDEQMARNLEWLVRQKFPNEKIIIWAANGHVMKYADSVTDKLMFVNMSTRFVRDPELRAQTYVLGFTSGEGRAGRLTMKGNTFNVAAVKKNSIEKWMDKSSYSFVDFVPFNKEYPSQKQEFWMKGYSHYYREEVWSRAFDGIFYIREMYPCTLPISLK